MIEIRDAEGDVVEVRISQQDFIDAGLQSPGGVILPGHPCHDVTLAQNLPPGWADKAANSCGAGAFVFKLGSGLMVPASKAELTEYLDGGEYDERLESIGESSDDFQT